MNMLINATPNQTMTSLEIAELTGKRHDSVKRTIEILSQATDKRPAVIQLPHCVEVKNHLGQSVTHYVFSGEQGKLDSVTITAQLCPELTAAIVKRWQELEAKQVLDLNNPESLRSALLGYTEKVIALEHQVETLTPKAIALDRIADTESLFTIRDAAKATKTKERDLVALLLRRGWAYRDSRNVMQPYAEKIAAGYVTSVVTRPITGQDGQDRVFTQLRITAKGVTRLSYLAAKGIAA